MIIKFRRETKIIFALLAVIILAALIFIGLNYRRLQQPSPTREYLGVRVN